jgi:O-antigen ligase
MEVITCNLIFGVGIGDATAELQKARDTLWHEYVFAYNSHNQYLQTALELGMIGLLVLLICIAIPSVISLQRNNFLYLIFIISFFLPSVIESTFGLQKGTLYYGFFNSFLFLYGSKVKFTKWGAKNKNFSVSS